MGGWAKEGNTNMLAVRLGGKLDGNWNTFFSKDSISYGYGHQQVLCSGSSLSYKGTMETGHFNRDTLSFTQ